jgi:hypothetical protein
MSAEITVCVCGCGRRRRLRRSAGERGGIQARWRRDRCLADGQYGADRQIAGGSGAATAGLRVQRGDLSGRRHGGGVTEIVV